MTSSDSTFVHQRISSAAQRITASPVESAFFETRQKREVGTTEHRYLHCTLMGLEGLSLLDISDTVAGIQAPPELVEIILHSMISTSTFIRPYSAPLRSIQFVSRGCPS